MRDRDPAQFDLRAATRRVLETEGFRPDFGPEVHARLASLPDAVARDQVRDMRDVPWSSIDNRESRDLDQIEAVEALGNGRVRVLVGIADVDAYVERGDPIDEHAGHATTSVYAGAIVFPMLPEALSTDLTSLNEDGDRLALVTELEVDARGEVVSGTMYRALVRNHAKLAYEDVAAWLEGRGPAPARVASSKTLASQLELQDRLAQQLHRARVEHGALELESAEARPVTQGDRVVDLKLVEKSRARQLIEDLMISANGVAARFIEDKGRSSIRRVVRSPKRWDRIVTLAASFGTTLPAEPDGRALSAFMAQRRAVDPDHMPDLSLAIVKLLGPGEYVCVKPGESLGHFGLAVPDYAHSTAPNRRYSDLVTQRIVKATIAGEAPPYDDAALAAIAARCTEREHAAQKVERTARKIAASLLLSRHIGQTYDAIVTGVTSKGTFVRLVAPPAEGRVVSGEEGMDVGDRVRVKLVDTEPSKGFIDFVGLR